MYSHGPTRMKHPTSIPQGPRKTRKYRVKLKKHRDNILQEKRAYSNTLHRQRVCIGLLSTIIINVNITTSAFHLMFVCYVSGVARESTIIFSHFMWWFHIFQQIFKIIGVSWIASSSIVVHLETSSVRFGRNKRGASHAQHSGFSRLEQNDRIFRDRYAGQSSPPSFAWELLHGDFLCSSFIF